MLKLANLRLALEDNRSLRQAVADYLKIEKSQIKEFKILKKALDARRKDKISFVYNVQFNVDNPDAILKKPLANISACKPSLLPDVEYGSKKLDSNVVVVGAGPCGLVAAYMLAKNGYKPILLERGLPIDERKAAVDDFWKFGKLHPHANVQFGEGGAGTFSDGKLTTRINDPVCSYILQLFVKCGAAKEIEYDSKPHIGTDVLVNVVKNLANRIKEYGGQIRYLSKLEKLEIQDGKIKKVILKDGRKIDCSALILATGHSARDTYKMLFDSKVVLEAKPFSVGVRIEHLQEIIDAAQYGRSAGHPKLGPADYSLVFHDKNTNRSVYSFCMCPGGKVVAATSSVGQVVTNGMSYSKRDSGVANSALAVGVQPSDFDNNPLLGMLFQEQLENLAYNSAGKNYFAPAQSVGSFLKGYKPDVKASFSPTYTPGITPVDLHKLLPSFVTDSLKNALVDFGRKIKGFDDDRALLTGVETRTSAPVRIVRMDNHQALGVYGLYPAGEGAGYAGGIMSAAIDGYYTALCVMKEFKA